MRVRPGSSPRCADARSASSVARPMLLYCQWLAGPDCGRTEVARTQPTEFSPASLRSAASRRCMSWSRRRSGRDRLEYPDMDGAGTLVERPAPPAMARVGHHRNHRQAGPRRQRGDARLQRQHRTLAPPASPRGRSRSGVPHASPARLPVSARAARWHRRSRSTAIMPAERHQRTEQRDAQQLALQHVAAARHQGEPDERVERRLMPRRDQRRAAAHVLQAGHLQANAADDAQPPTP